MVILEIGLQTPQDFDRIFHRRLVDVDFLETTAKRPVFFEVLTELLVGRRAHGAELATSQSRLEQVGRVHCTARCCARTDHSVDLIDEQYSIFMLFKLGDDGLEAFFEIAAIARSRQQCPHIERVDRCLGQYFGCFASYDLACQTLGDGGLADPGIPHQQRVVLATAAKHLNATFDFLFPSDQRINVAFARFGVQVDTVFLKRAFFFLAFGHALWLFLGFRRSGYRSLFAIGRVFCHAMRNEIHGVVARHVLFLQKICSVAFAFGENRNEYVRAGDFGAARRLYMDCGALDHALERRRRYCFRSVNVRHEVAQVLVHELDQRFAQIFRVHTACFHNARCIRLVYKCE